MRRWGSPLRPITDCGPINPNLERCYIHASCLHKGKLYLGETDGFSPSLHIVDLGSISKVTP